MSLSSGHTQSLCVWPSGRSGRMRVVPAQTFHPPAGDVDSDCKSLENMPGEMATYLQRWTGSSSHSRPGGRTGSKLYALVCGTHLPSPGRGWGGVQVKLHHPCPPQGSSKTCYWDEHTVGNLQRFTHQQLYPSKPPSLGSWNSLPRDKDQSQPSFRWALPCPPTPSMYQKHFGKPWEGWGRWGWLCCPLLLKCCQLICCGGPVLQEG